MGNGRTVLVTGVLVASVKVLYYLSTLIEGQRGLVVDYPAPHNKAAPQITLLSRHNRPQPDELLHSY